MDKERVAKDILQSVDICAKQLNLIKSQVIDYLSENKSNKKSNKMTHFRENSATAAGDEENRKRGRGGREDSPADDSEQDSGEKSDLSDPEFTVSAARGRRGLAGRKTGGRKGRGRPKKAEDGGEEPSGARKGRGRPKKAVYDEAASSSDERQRPGASSDGDGDDLEPLTVSKGRGRPSTHGKQVSGESDEEEEEPAAKKGRGRPSKNGAYVNGAVREKVVSSRGRGRPSKGHKVEKVQSSGPKKGRGRPSNKAKVVENEEEAEEEEEDDDEDHPGVEEAAELEGEGQ